MHLTKAVQNFGPLWTTSTFNYEGMNGLLRDMIPQPKEPLLQIALRYQLFHNSYYGAQSNAISQETQEFCDQLFKDKKSQKKSREIIDLANENNENVQMLSYNQYVIKKVVYCKESYSDGKSNDDSCIHVHNKFYIIKKIYKNIDTNCSYFMAQELKINHVLYDDFYNYSIINVTKLLKIDDSVCIEKCIKIPIRDDSNFLVIIKHFLLHD